MDTSGFAGLLSHLSIDEYREILNDDDKFESLFKDIKQIKEWEAEKEMIIASNRSLADFNLGKESALLEAKQIVMDKSAIGEELCKSVQDKLEEFKSKASGVSADTTLALLETAAAQSEEESENVAQDFLDGKLDMDKFLEDFTKVRIAMHLRKVKADKMAELLRSRRTDALFGTSGAPARPAPYPPAPYAGQGVPLPYPGYPNPSMPYPPQPAMPMPGMYGGHF